MSEENPFICVPTESGEQVRQHLLELGILDINRKIESNEGKLFFPLTREIDLNDIFPETDVSEWTTGFRDFASTITGPRTVREALENKLSESELDLLPRAYDLIGDIAVLEIPTELDNHRFTIGEAFLQVRPNFVTILGKKGAISGTLRTREYELLAGIDKTDTTHIEYGCKISVDLAKAYFSPRLLEEHNRITQLVQENEHIVDMFTGVGPFALHIARKVNVNVKAVDINSEAIQLLQSSMTMNRLLGQIEPINQDIREYTKTAQPHQADRVIMNHPSGASDFIQEACHLLKEGGIIHYYDFMGGEDPEGALSTKLVELIENTDRKVKERSLIRRVRDSAPYEYHMVIDATIQ
ncbi:MAG: class I SAM-dependent methyltransferase [Candidatus Thorarchaeota archaeon]|jgi:tRNA (guanine37-N1)-methyltransferase